MTEPNITTKRTGIRTLLVAVVVTAAIVGTVGTASVIDGKGNDVLTGSRSDAGIYAFPINNVTVLSYQTTAVESSSSASQSVSDASAVLDDAYAAVVWPQNMDPY